MAKVYEHLSEEELEERYVACSNATVSRHFVIWRLARGYSVWEVSETQPWRATDRAIARPLD
jgi:hypothetical protein